MATQMKRLASIPSYGTKSTESTQVEDLPSFETALRCFFTVFRTTGSKFPLDHTLFCFKRSTLQNSIGTLESIRRLMFSFPSRSSALGRANSRLVALSYGSFSNISPAEAGRRAAALASQRSKKQSNLPTYVAHAGIQDIPNAPMAPPLHVATTYTRPVDGNYLETDSIYSRQDNPTRLLLEKTIFQLETIGLAHAREETKPTSWAFSSGMMAITAIVLAHSTPLTIILPSDLYHGTMTVMFNVFNRHNVEVRSTDMSVVENILEEISKVDSSSEVIVWMETPSNPKCQVIDIRAVTEAVMNISTHKVTTVVDATMASPIVTRPLEVSGVQSEFVITKQWAAAHGVFPLVWSRYCHAFWDQVSGGSFGCAAWSGDDVSYNRARESTRSKADVRADVYWRGGLSMGLVVGAARDTDVASTCRASVQNGADSCRVSSWA